MRYRRQIQEHVTNYQHGMMLDLGQFMSALLTSLLPVADQIERVLKQGDPQMIEHAIHIGATILRISSLAPAMIHVYNTTSDEDLRFDIIQNLGYLDHDQAHQLLLHVLQHHTDAQLRVAAAYALQSGTRPDAVAPLLAIAHNTAEHPLLRGQAIEALAYQGDESLVTQILPYLQAPEANIRWDALYTVGQLGNMDYAFAIEPLLNDTTVVFGKNGTIADDVREILDRWTKYIRVGKSWRLRPGMTDE
jgi:hypothetical protein